MVRSVSMIAVALCNVIAAAFAMQQTEREG